MAVKGSAVIELTDVKTGKKERYVENNMVTNALAELLKPIGYLKGSGIYSDSANLVQSYLGGMLLFDKQIPEDSNQLFPPAEASVVGYGAYNITNNSAKTELGTYNVNESEYNTYSKYMKFVYDFTTSQANGTINCVCLTHLDAAQYSAYGADSSRSYNGKATGIRMSSTFSKTPLTSGKLKTAGYQYGDYAHVFLVDTAEDLCYCFGVIDTNTIKISKYRAGILSTCVVCAHSTIRTLLESFEIPLAESIKTAYVSWNYEHDDDCLYICTASATTITSSGSFNIIKISVSDWDVTQYTIANPTGATLASEDVRFAYVHQGYAYLKNGSTVYKINIEDPSDWIKISGTLTNSGALPQMAINGRIFYEYFTYVYYNNYHGYMSVVNGALNKVEKPDYNGIFANGVQEQQCTTPIRNEPFHWLGNTSTLFCPRNYLATINNLARPIEKTSDKTMKITYTIQEM